MIAQWEHECISLTVLSVARVMIAQWENECISLTVLSVARVMIAQWENECISLTVLSGARVMIAQWENECISLTVLSVARVMIAQWENECISMSVLPVARVRFPAEVDYFKGSHTGASRMSPNDAPWETLSLRLSRPISVPLLAENLALSWRHETWKNSHTGLTSVQFSRMAKLPGVVISYGLARSTCCGSVSLLQVGVQSI